jgi:uncharacterized protein (TIGR02266 family)
MLHHMTIASRRCRAVALGKRRLSADLGTGPRPVQTERPAGNRRRSRGSGEARGQPSCWIDELREGVVPLTRVKSAGTRDPRPHPSPIPEQQHRWRSYPARVDLSWHSAHNFFTGLTGEIREGGLFVATQAPWPEGQRLELHFTLPGLRRVCTARAIVDWVRNEHAARDPQLPPGMGLRFEQLEPRDLPAIRSFISRRQPLLYEI